jgi:hypothetical protein
LTVTSNITVTISPKFTAIDAGTAAMTLTATVNNDTAGNGGVTWTLKFGSPLQTCPQPACGTLTPGSGGPPFTATYTPPGTVPTGAGQNMPTITATAVDDPSK